MRLIKIWPFIWFPSLVTVIISLFGCALSVSGDNLISEIVYPSFVPASYETMIVCQPGVNHYILNYRWSSDNGTIKAVGPKAIWMAPAVPGDYRIVCMVKDAAGRTEEKSVIVHVIASDNTIVADRTEVTLNYSIWSKHTVCEQCSMMPLSTLEIFVKDYWPISSDGRLEWSCNGGKLHIAPAAQQPIVSVGWTSPGIPGNYTIFLLKNGIDGYLYTGQVFVNIKQPHCCEIDFTRPLK